MSDPRVLELLEDILESGRTPEEACGDSPELLWEVKERLRQCLRADAEIDAVFPPNRGASDGETCAAPDLRQGRPQIPGYEVEAVLGRGGVGVVYQARQLKLNRTVALKMLLAGVYARESDLARFVREAQAVASLRHAHVVQIYDAGEINGLPYFTMEYVEGGSLAQKLAGTPQPGRDAAGLVATLAQAVQAAHEAGIVHRDLKPSNILLTGDGTPKVSDFGLARHFEGKDDLTLSGARLGTPSYMSPEQAAGKADAVGPPADVYALGAILYEALTGRPPFRGESSSDTERQVITQEPVPPSRLNPKVPRDLETICLKCLQKAPHHRYASAAALAEDLRRFGRGEPVAARRATRVERLAKWVRRRPGLAAAVAAGALLAAVLVGAASWLITERAAMVRAVEADLNAAAAAQQRSAWPEATAALERATARLGSSGPSDLRHRVDEYANNMALVRRLDAVRLWRVQKRQAAQHYLAIFTDAGLGNLLDDPGGAAARIRASPIRAEWVAALDDWAMGGTDDRGHKDALLEAARAADPDSSWRHRVRDRKAWSDPAALRGLAKSAQIADQPVHLLIAVGTALEPRERTDFLRRVQAAHPGDFYANLVLAFWLKQAAEHEDAVAFFRAAVAVRPDSGGAHYYLGEGLRAAGRTKEALGHFRRAVHLDPNDAWAHSGLGAALRETGKPDEAFGHLHGALRIDPTYVRGHNELGVALLEKGRPEEALAAFRRALELDPKDAWAYGNAGVALAALGHGEKAIESFRKSLELNRGDAPTHSNLAAALVSAGRDDEAMEHLAKALQLDPNHATAHVRTANVLMRRGQRDGAIEHYRQALRIDPKYGLAHLSLGMALEGRGDLGEAAGHYRRAVDLRVQDPRAVIKLAALLVAQGNAEEARTTWRRTLDANPAGHDAWHGYAELCLYLGDHAEYRRARVDLISRFGDTNDPLIAERTVRACLLLPLAEDELTKVATLVERAAAGKGSKAEWFHMTKGLLAYRQGRLDAAIGLMQREASGILGPTPRLVLAMAMHRAGRRDDAMTSLAAAAIMFDWRPAAARGFDGWIFHALRREAESAILPNLPAFLEGRYQPSGNDERLALIPACQFNNRPCAVAGLFADALAADPGMADDLARGVRYNAACAAALAGSGVGDGAALNDEQRSRWRDQARRWLRADLAAWARLADAGGPTPGKAHRWLTHWQSDPDLAALREPRTLSQLPLSEQADCFSLWAEVTAVLRRAQVHE